MSNAKEGWGGKKANSARTNDEQKDEGKGTKSRLSSKEAAKSNGIGGWRFRKTAADTKQKRAKPEQKKDEGIKSSAPLKKATTPPAKDLPVIFLEWARNRAE